MSKADSRQRIILRSDCLEKSVKDLYKVTVYTFEQFKKRARGPDLDNHIQASLPLCGCRIIKFPAS